MGKVVVLTTGGTIASVASSQDGLYSSGRLTGNELLGMQDLGLTCPVDVESVFQLPSNHLTFDLLLALRDRAARALADPETDGVVITHGTDTLEESCYFLDLTLDSDKPVVMTGSQRVPSELGSDSFVNIRQAVLAAASPRTRGMGVLALFNERLYTARRVRKMHAFNPHAFTSFGYGYAGYVDKSDVAVYQKPVARECYSPRPPFPRVDVYKAFLGGDGALIDAAAAAGARGLVLEGEGRGHIPPAACEAVSRAVDQGVAVVVTTACEEGRVHPVYDFAGGVRDLTARGVIPGGDYDAKKARVKLAVLLASGVRDRAALAAAFAR